MNIQLTDKQAEDLVMILGAAHGVFDEMSNDPEIRGVFRILISDYSTRADELSKLLVGQINTKRPK